MITTLELKNKIETILPSNHVFCVDVSYSMYSTLPKLRNMLKSTLPTLVKDGDTVSVIYFSGSNQCGTVFVGEEIKSVSDLTSVNTAIDKYLTPIGCTSFIKPLETAMQVASDLNNGNLNSMIFLTDGYHNEGGSESKILETCEKLPLVFADINIIEYGYYCNRSLLEKMTEATNAFHAFTESYSDFEPAFGEIVSSTKSTKIAVEVGEATHAVYVEGDRVYTVPAQQGVALVPEHVSSVWTLGESAIEVVDSIDDIQLLYVVLHHALHTMNPDLAWKVLKKLGDVAIIKKYDNAFTKQDYSVVKDMISSAVVDENSRFVDGIDYNLVPNENAVTVGDVLETLINANAMVDIKSEHFSYNRTGRATVQKEDDTIEKLSDAIANAETAEERKALAMQMVEHEEWTPKFENVETLVPMNKVVTNSSRPNISINTDMKGFVSIPESIRSKYGLPSQVDTKIYRNYTVVKDGIINMKSIPVIVPVASLADLVETGVKFETYQSERAIAGEVAVIVHVDSVPLVNRAMAKGISGQQYMRNAVMLQEFKARQKVMKFYRDELLGGRSATNAANLAALYGADAAKFLSENGIRDYGFSPKVTRAESTDFYNSKELNVKIKGLSSLPAVNAVIKKVDTNKKLNAADTLMWKAIEDYRNSTAGMDDTAKAEWLKIQSANAIVSVRAMEQAMSKVMYGIVVAKSWFADVDFEDAKMTVSYEGFPFDVTIELEEKQIKI